MLTILCYTIFTGLSLLPIGVWDFNAYRFLCRISEWAASSRWA